MLFSILVMAVHTYAYDGGPYYKPAAGAPSGYFFVEADFAHAEALGFSTLALSTPKSFKFYRSNAISMNMTAKGAGITLGQYCQILPSSSPSNPSHVSGIRSFFEVEYAVGTGASPAVSTATIEITFATGLPTNGYLLFMDFDANERIDIKAYNASNVLIPYSDMTFTRENGRVASGSPSTTMKWDDLGASYTGRIYESGGTSADFPVMTLKSAQVIKKLVYEVNMNPGASSSLNNTMWFNFVTPTAPATVYVNHAAAGANNGTSWANAYTSLQTGIENAFPGDQVWVAKGTYKPSSAYELTNTSRFYHFRLPSSVSIYGVRLRPDGYGATLRLWDWADQ